MTDRERAMRVLLGIPDAEDRVAYMVEQLAAERSQVLSEVARALAFTPLSERESGITSDYTKGLHAAAKIVRLLADHVALVPNHPKATR